MHNVIDKFIDDIRVGRTEVYNEFSLQHELGIHLRQHTNSRKVQFERNVSFFGLQKEKFIKREIDISIFGTEKAEREAIELKYPRNGQHPEQMFSFCKDIMFLEQLLESGFRRAHLLILAEGRPFYAGNPDGIYGYFRAQKPLTGHIQKPTGSKNEEYVIRGTYVVKWHTIKDSLKYCLIEIQSPSGI